jgi:hypothetical protein
LLHGEVLSLPHQEGFDRLFAIYIEALTRPRSELRLQKLHLQSMGIEGAVAAPYAEVVASFTV